MQARILASDATASSLATTEGHIVKSRALTLDGSHGSLTLDCGVLTGCMGTGQVHGLPRDDPEVRSVTTLRLGGSPPYVGSLLLVARIGSLWSCVIETGLSAVTAFRTRSRGSVLTLDVARDADWC